MSLESRFDIDPPIHIGQITAAYPALQKKLGRRVFLKVIHPQWAADEELVQRFEREAQTMAQINHPNVVKVYDYGIEDGIPYMALEWIDGGTLADKINQGPVGQNELKKIAKHILSGLETVHDIGLLHRDMKPDNILTGSDGIVRLADFSLAGFEKKSGLTEHGAVIGTPAYMAPEIIDGMPASIQSDLYGVGMILFEALTGSNPYKAADPIVSMELIRKNQPQRLSDNPKIDSGLAALIDNLIKRDPTDRPENAISALNILEGRTGTFIAKPEPGFQSEISHPKSKRKIYLTGYVFAVVIIVLFLVYSVFFNTGDFPADDYKSDDAFITNSENNNNNNGKISELTKLETIKTDSANDVLLENGSRNIEKLDTAKKSPPEKANEEVLSSKPAPQQEKIATGKLSLIVKPWAQVFIDGEDYGATPLGTIELESGKRNLRLEHDIYPAIEKRIEIPKNETALLAVDLKEEAAQAVISATPWGFLWIDQDSLGLLPRTDPVWLSPGIHLISVRHPRLNTWQDSVELKPNKIHRLAINLKDGTVIANTSIER